MPRPHLRAAIDEDGVYVHLDDLLLLLADLRMQPGPVAEQLEQELATWGIKVHDKWRCKKAAL